MFLSIVEATGMGSPVLIAAPPYIDQSHIFVDVNGVTTTPAWINSSTVSVTAPVGASIRVFRRTSPAARLVQFQDGHSTPSGSLNTDSLQAFYLTQEAYDTALMAQGGEAIPGTTTDPTALLAGTGAALVGFSPGAFGAHTVGAKLTETVSVKDYGAVGDGVADDTAAFLLAVTGVGAAGGTILIPRGKYRITAPIILPFPAQYHLKGDGGTAADNNIGSTEIIKAASMTSAAIVANGQFCRISDLVLRGEVGNTGDGIQVSGHGFRGDNVAVFKMGQDGWRIGTDAGVNANNWHLVNCRAVRCLRHGFHVSDKLSLVGTGPDVNAGTAIACFSQLNTLHGFYLGKAIDCSFFCCTSEQNSGQGMRIAPDSANNAIFGGDYEGNFSNQIQIEAGALSNGVFWPNMWPVALSDLGTGTRYEIADPTNKGSLSKGIYQLTMGNPGGPSDIIAPLAGYLRLFSNGDTPSDTSAQLLLSSSGSRLGKVGGAVGFCTSPTAISTGYGTPTGGAKMASFAAGTITLPQLAGVVAQLILDLKTKGLLAT
jgi:hypothetical protein